MDDPTKGIRTVCPYCGVGCGMVLQVSNNRVTKVIGDKNHPANGGRLCTKGSTCAGTLEATGRLAFGSIRESRDGKFIQQPIDQILGKTAAALRGIVDKHGPDAVAFYVSGQMSLESQYLSTKLCKGFIGTNNIDSNSRLCMSSAASGYKLSLGADGPPGSYADIEKSHCFLVIGSNMAECHPILFLRVLDRLKTKGVKLIVVDPRKTPTAEKADLFLPIKPGTDLAFLNGILHLLVKNNRIDRDFIARHTADWPLLESFLEEYTPEKVAEMTGLDADAIRTAAQWIGDAPEFVSFWTMGLNQSTHGTWHTNAICNLHLAMGKICRPGSGPFSLTGQPNAMGGREVGYLSHGLPGQRTVIKAEDRAFLENLWGLKAGAIQPKPGHDAVTLFQKLESGEVKAVWIICTNPVASMPRRQRVIEGLQKAELVIVQDAYHPTETTKYADVLLPGALWAEADGVMINSERNVTLMAKAIDPPGEALPDWQIIARIAQYMGYADGFSYNSASDVFDEIRRTWNPKTGYDLRGISYEKLRKQPMQWPCGPDDEQGRSIRYVEPSPDAGSASAVEPTFPTDDGKGHFFARPCLPPAEQPDEDFPFILITGRVAHQWHTMTKTGKIPTLNKLNPGPFVEIHPDDAEALKVKTGDKLSVGSRRGAGVYPVTVTPRIRPGACFVPFHWNDLFGENLAINAATTDAVDPLSMQPEFKFCAVKLVRVEEAPAAEPTAPTPAKKEMRPEIQALFEAFGCHGLAPMDFDAGERRYLHGFVSGLSMAMQPGASVGVPVLPETARFSGEKREWVNGLLGGIFSRAPVGRVLVAESVPNAVATRDDKPVLAKPTVTILFGSQTGNAEGVAHRLAKALADVGTEAPVFPLDDFAKSRWSAAGTTLIVTSTYGDGEPPDNAKRFWEFVTSDKAPKLEGVSYAVLALGDRNYEQFCKFGRDVDERLEHLGARRIHTRVDCDGDFEGSAESWVKSVGNSTPAPNPGGNGAAPRSSQSRRMSKVSGADVPAPAAVIDQPRAYSKSNPFPARLIANRVLTAPASEKEVRHFEFSLLDSGLSYEPGDALGIYPVNGAALVDEILELIKLTGSERVDVDGSAVELRQALTQFLDIAKPSFPLQQALAASSGGPLRKLLEPDSKDALRNYLWGRQTADILREHPNAAFEPQTLVTLLSKLQPRLYSISSSPKANPGQVHATIGVVRYDRDGRARTGVCSGFLADRASESVPVFIQPSANFKLPKSGDTPVIMVGPGTGIAPFRAFLQERQAIGAKGRNWLFFGDQRESANFLYRDELHAMEKSGLSRLTTAFSRDSASKVYVQHRMAEYGAELWSWLADGAHFYICGDASRMAKDVEESLARVIEKHGRMSLEQSKEYLAEMRSQKRYQRDVY